MSSISRYEFMVKEALPALRSVIANELINTYKMTQTEVAKRINLSQAAVSQYARKLRGAREIKSSRAMRSAMELCEKIYNKRISGEQLNSELLGICSAWAEDNMPEN